MKTNETIILPDQGEMLQAVGKGIQAFAVLEHALTMLFASLMEPGNRLNSFYALEAARHFEAKLNIVKAVAAKDLKPNQLIVFRELEGRCNGCNKMRNKLAHWMVSFWPGASSAKEARKMKVALVPPLSSSKSGKVILAKDQPIHLKQINDYIKKCDALAKDLYKFSFKVSDLKKQDK